MDNAFYTFDGICPVCRSKSTFTWTDRLQRDSLLCHVCEGYSVPRERALMLVLDKEVPDWRERHIHESSPAERGASLVLRKQCNHYTATQFMKGVPLGTMSRGFRCEDLHAQTFADASFDVVITLDVMEHVNDFEAVMRDITRTLRPGGVHIFTTPTYKMKLTTERRASYGADGTVTFIGEPEYHGNPVDGDGSPVTFHFGYDFPELINRASGCDVSVTRFWDETHGILGDMTEVYVCRKRGRLDPVDPGADSLMALVNNEQQSAMTPTPDAGVEIVDRFSTLTNDQWLSVMMRSVREPVINGVEFPRFPHSSIQLGYNGASNEDGIMRAHAFWTYAEKWARALGKPLNRDSRILDIGCGWGRVTRMFARDTGTDGITGCDIDSDALSVCRYLGVPGKFVKNQPGQALPFADNQFSLLTAYSVFMHLSESVALSIFSEMNRVAKKGCLFVFTVEDETFLDYLKVPDIETRSERWRLLSRYKNQVDELKGRYRSGEYVYLVTNEESVRSSEVYGDALVSPEWLKAKAAPYFRVLGYYPAKAPVYQAVVVAIKD